MFMGLLRSAFSAHTAKGALKKKARPQPARKNMKARKLLMKEADMARIVGAKTVPDRLVSAALAYFCQEEIGDLQGALHVARQAAIHVIATTDT